MNTARISALLACAAATAIVACGGGTPGTDAGDVIETGDTVEDTAIADADDDNGPFDIIIDDWYTGDSGDTAGFHQPPEPWPQGPAAPESSLFSDYNLYQGQMTFNSWTEEIEWQFDGDTPVVDASRLAYYAIGNGHTFSFVGTDYPLSVLHESVGPDYTRQKLETFPDIKFTAQRDGAAVKFTKSRIGRFAKNSIVGVTNQTGDLLMTTLFVAPKTEDAQLDTTHMVVVRLDNTGVDTMVNLNVASMPYSGATDTGTPGALQIARLDRDIYMVLDGGTWIAEKKTFVGPTVSIAGGDHVDFVFWLYFTEGEAAVDPAPEFAEKAAATNVQEVINATGDWWKDWFAQGLQVNIPDVRLMDLLESFLYTVKSQTTYDGAMTPLSHYGEYWTRDLSGGVRLLAMNSRADDVKTMLDYHRAAACAYGGFFNATEVDRPLGVPCAVKDWMALPVMAEKTAAEAPSYVVHMYHRHFDMTGDSGLMKEREQMLRYGMLKQNIDESFLLPFSDDETFRAALAMNLGIGGPETMFAASHWSLQSTLLYIAAADGLAGALGYGPEDDVVKTRDGVFATLEDYYWQDAEGFYAPILSMADLSPHMHPYEDVNFTISWMNLEDTLGWDRVHRDVNKLVELSWMPDLGIIQTNLGNLEPLLEYDLSLGLATGMTPGFTLYAFARHRSDLAEQAFNAFPQIVTASGNVTEDFATLGFRPLMPLYDPAGKVGEVWARFRPWEGGQDGEAILFYLTGLYPDAAGKRVALKPHIPNMLPYAEYRGLMAAGCLIDMKLTEVDEDERLYELKFTGDKCNDLTVTLTTGTSICGQHDGCKPEVSTSDDIELDAKSALDGIAIFTAADNLSATFTARTGGD